MDRDPAPLLFDAIVEQIELLDEDCDDPRLTPYILAIRLLAQRGFDKCATQP